MFWLKNHYTVPILMYHHVTAKTFHGLDNVTPASFERQMRYLKDHNYRVISLKDFIEGTGRGEVFKYKTVLITFDDGHENNYTNAFPVLKKYGFPATIFVVAGKLGTPGFFSWDAARIMQAHGVDIEPHSLSHAYLPGLSKENAWAEINESKRMIEERLGKNANYFCYPSGGFTFQVQQLVKEAGIKGAVTTNRGDDRVSKRDLFALKRVRVKDRDERWGGIIFWAKLSGYYNISRKLKQGH